MSAGAGRDPVDADAPDEVLPGSGDELAASDDADEALLAELADLLAADAHPPQHVLHAARESFTWRTVDAEIAALTFDSLLDHEPARSRSTATDARTLTFGSGDVTIELEIDVAGDRRRVIGQLVPPQTAEVELTVHAEPIHATADALGRFVLPLPASPRLARLLVRLVDGTRIVAERVAL